MGMITIDGIEYDSNVISAEAKSQLDSLKATDAEIQRLQIQLAIAQTARAAYGKALRQALSESLGP